MNSCKVLIVEDEPDVCAALQSFLGRRGFSVSTTASGSHALGMIPVFCPDLILLDITLLDLNGIEVLRRLRSVDQKTKVIIITGQLLPAQEIDTIRSLGISEYIQKPLVLSQVEVLFSRVLGGMPQAPAASFETCSPQNPVMHRMTNLLGVMRAQTEAFLLNEQDGFHKDKGHLERLEMAKDIMKDILVKIEETARILDLSRS